MEPIFGRKLSISANNSWLPPTLFEAGNNPKGKSMNHNISNAALALLADLRDNADSCESTHQDGSAWVDVYLPNAQGNRSKAQFGGLLNALKEAGYYQPIDHDFGSVKR